MPHTTAGCSSSLRSLRLLRYPHYGSVGNLAYIEQEYVFMSDDFIETQDLIKNIFEEAEQNQKDRTSHYINIDKC
jgi:hypothetical protein